MTTPETVPEVTAVVPTVGLSPWLEECLEALRDQDGVRSLEIVVVDQAPRPLALPRTLADRVLRPGRNLGFAGGTNAGIAATAGSPLVATVNDDAIVGAGWLATLAAALRANPSAAAAQGMNVLGHPDEPRAARVKTGADTSAGGATDGAAAGHPAAGREGPAVASGGALEELHAPHSAALEGHAAAALIDGCGLGWNRWWQAIQLRHGEPAPPPGVASRLAEPGAPPAVFEVFGVSATAALFRRAALERVARGGQVFDPRLISYYEDADLAGRLRAAGFIALLAPAARALHAGSASAGTAGSERWRLVYGNRYLAAARLLGRGFWPRLPLMALRDGLDLTHLLDPRGGTERLAGMVAGWGRAIRHLPSFAHRGASVPPPAEVARLSRLGWLGLAREPAPDAAVWPQPPGQPG
jgi:GT2 family glycosyltransferase